MTLEKALLAENVKLMPEGGGFHTVEFDWLCPRCGKRHWARELSVKLEHMRGLWMALGPCPINVRMPWADRTPRDKQSVYGQLAETEVQK